MDTQTEIDLLIARQSSSIQEVARAVQKLIRETGLDLEEDVSTKLSILYFKHNGVVCALSLHKAHANLHFYKGLELEDPHGVLQGSGGKLRHIRYQTAADLDPGVLERYVRAAYALNAP
jgi:hypothetical protein